MAEVNLTTTEEAKLVLWRLCGFNKDGRLIPGRTASDSPLWEVRNTLIASLDTGTRAAFVGWTGDLDEYLQVDERAVHFEAIETISPEYAIVKVMDKDGAKLGLGVRHSGEDKHWCLLWFQPQRGRAPIWRSLYLFGLWSLTGISLFAALAVPMVRTLAMPNAFRVLVAMLAALLWTVSPDILGQRYSTARFVLTGICAWLLIVAVQFALAQLELDIVQLGIVTATGGTAASLTSIFYLLISSRRKPGG